MIGIIVVRSFCQAHNNLFSGMMLLNCGKSYNKLQFAKFFPDISLICDIMLGGLFKMTAVLQPKYTLIALHFIATDF